jgi:hypothetical protein
MTGSSLLFGNNLRERGEKIKLVVIEGIGPSQLSEMEVVVKEQVNFILMF